MDCCKIDVKTSEALVKEFPGSFFPHLCYENVCDAVYHKVDFFKSGKWKVAYGYISAPSNRFILIRHCFILDVESNMAIDPTAALLVQNTGAEYPGDYYIMYIFDSVEDYVQALIAENQCISLESFLQKYDEDFASWAKEHSFAIAEPTVF